MKNTSECRNTGTLYIVATPIGNLSDISERAVSTLERVDFIAAEDTRVTRVLTAHLGINKPFVSYRAANMRECGDKILARVLSGESCALVTDAGTPVISDPGGDLVRLFAENNIPVAVIPGPCAAVAAVAVSGLPAGRFVFEGFLPSAGGKRRAQLESLRFEQRTMVFYEAPHRILQTLSDMLEIFGDRNISVSRELTKIHEETIRTTLSDAVGHFTENTPRGEFVIVTEGRADTGKQDEDLIAAKKIAKALTECGLTTRDAVKKAASVTGCSRNGLYKAVAETS